MTGSENLPNPFAEDLDETGEGTPELTPPESKLIQIPEEPIYEVRKRNKLHPGRLGAAIGIKYTGRKRPKRGFD